MNKKVRVVLVILILALMPVLWQSCTGALTPEEIIFRANWTMNAVGSYHVTGSYSTSSNNSLFEDLLNIEVEFSVPERYRFNITEPDNSPESIILIGDEYYINIRSSYYDPAGDIYPAVYAVINSFKRESTFYNLSFLKDIDVFTNEAIDSSDCYHFIAVLDKEKVLENQRDYLQELRRNADLPEYSEEELTEEIEYLSSLLTDITFNIELWIDNSNFHIRKMGLTQSQIYYSNLGDTQNVTELILEFSMVNAPITIEPPLKKGYFQPGWIKLPFN
jgi:outer membrane lipoprotein-sorting protein